MRVVPPLQVFAAEATCHVWKLVTGEKGLQPNLFWDLVMVTIMLTLPLIISEMLPDHQPVHRAVAESHDGVSLLPVSANNIMNHSLDVRKYQL